jgi:hypothetical protein
MPELKGLGMKVVWAAVILALAGGIGLLLHQPWLFPSLGPTAMLMLESPDQPSARFVDAIVGHVMAVVVGLAALVACGLYGQPSAPTAGLSVRYVVAGVVSVAVTMLVLGVVHRSHPPAGATTLLVSLGILTTPAEVASVLGAVVLVAGLSWVATRAARRAQPSREAAREH